MNIDTLNRYTGAIDALCLEAAHSDNEYDLSVMLALLGEAEWGAESILGYNLTLAGEVDHWTNSCWEDSRTGHWLPRLEAVTKSVESFDQQVAIALALHRGRWYLGRVRLFGAAEYA